MTVPVPLTDIEPKGQPMATDRHVLCPECQAGNPIVPAVDKLFRCPECGLHWKFGVSYMRVTTVNRDLIEIVGDALDQAREDRRDG